MEIYLKFKGCKVLGVTPEKVGLKLLLKYPILLITLPERLFIKLIKNLEELK